MPVPYINRSPKKGYFFAKIMEKIKKGLIFCLIISFGLVLFLLSESGYCLRVPMNKDYWRLQDITLKQTAEKLNIKMTDETRVALLIGGPQIIEPEACPEYRQFAYGFKSTGQDIVVLPYVVQSEEELELILTELRQNKKILGAIVTAPWKTKVLDSSRISGAIPFESQSERAQEAGAANLIIKEPDGHLSADSNDGIAWVKVYKDETGEVLNGKNIVIIGAGGAGREIVAAVAHEGASSIVISDQMPDRARNVVEIASGIKENPDISIRAAGIDSEDLRIALSNADVIINATPVGMTGGGQEGQSPISESMISSIKKGTHAFDIVLAPLYTLFLQQAELHGAIIHKKAADLMSVLTNAMHIEAWVKADTGYSINIDQLYNTMLEYFEESSGNHYAEAKREIFPDGSTNIYIYGGTSELKKVLRCDRSGKVVNRFKYPIALSTTNWDRWRKLMEEFQNKSTSPNNSSIFTKRFEDRFKNTLSVPENRVVVATKQGRDALAILYGLLTDGHPNKPIRVAMSSFTYHVTLTSFDISKKLYGNNNLFIPIFIDIDPETLLMDYADLEKKLQEVEIDAVVAVDMGGNVNDYVKLAEITRKHGALFYIDGTHNVTGTWDDIHSCQIGDGTVLSFSFSKPLNGGQFSSGGALIIPRSTYSELEKIGIISKVSMSDEQAIYLLANLEFLYDNVTTRNKFANLYREGLKDIPGVTFQKILPEVQNPNYALFMIFIDEFKFGMSRDQLREELAYFSVEAIPYFAPLHLRPDIKYGVSLPKTESVSKTTLALPFSQSMQEEDILQIISIIKSIRERYLRDRLLSPVYQSQDLDRSL